MNCKETREAAETMLHFAEGGEVEVMAREGNHHWQQARQPTWNWTEAAYRIKRCSDEGWAQIVNGNLVRAFPKIQDETTMVHIKWEEC